MTDLLGGVRKHTFGPPKEKRVVVRQRRAEDLVQADLVRWLREHGELVIRTENAARRKYGALKEKALGLHPGMSDLLWVRSNAVWFIECKSQVGKQKPDQAEFQRVVTAMGHGYLIGKSAENLIMQCQEIIRG